MYILNMFILWSTFLLLKLKIFIKKAILPYSEYQAKGYEILRDLENDNIALNERYWAHIFYGTKKNDSLIFITDW